MSLVPDLFTAMKQIAKDVFDTLQPADWCYGKVISLDPFQVQIDQKLPLKKEFLAVRTGMSVSSFKVGDRLILLRKQGGQEYLILDKKGAL